MDTSCEGSASSRTRGDREEGEVTLATVISATAGRALTLRIAGTRRRRAVVVVMLTVMRVDWAVRGAECEEKC